MLAVSILRGTTDEIKSAQGEMGDFSSIVGEVDEFGEFSDGNLLESINFDDLFVGINVQGVDELPDLDMGPEILSEFSMESSENMNYSSSLSVEHNDNRAYQQQNSTDNGADQQQNSTITGKQEEEEEEEEDCDNKVSSAWASNCGSSRAEEETVNKRDESTTTTKMKPSTKEGERKGRKSSAQSKNSQGKRKVKVDWTPELHRRFVKAVEQLGVDKAVPSKILEIMGIACLTRHNIASHLQKYRSHRKHLLAREAEAARWNKRREVRPWVAAPPALCFPQMAPPSPSTMPQYFRPLHVWGHPTMDHHSFIAHWPKHHPLPHPMSPPAWPYPTAPPPPAPSFWHPHGHHQQAADPKALTSGIGSPYCFPQPTPLTTTGFGSPPVPGIPPHGMFTADPDIRSPTGKPAGPWPVFDFHPSKESIDAALGDVLSKPWLPLPLGLKAPAIDSVLSELQRQGIPKIPPSCA